MKAVVYEKYGSPEVLELRETGKPAPGDNEVRIKIYATSVTAGDVRMRQGKPFAARLYNGLLRPGKIKILGFELAGTVDAAGKLVKKYRPGDEVFALNGFRFGGYADYRCLPVNEAGAFGGLIALKPKNLSFAEAAAGIATGGITALTVLKKAGSLKGRKVLIYGASGSVGSFAVQLAKHFGAEVTGVCGGANADMVKALGAGSVIDYKTEDFTASGESWDVIFDAVDRISAGQTETALTNKGIFLNVRRDSSSGKDITAGDLIFLKELTEAGELKPVIDRQYRLEQIVEAHRYVDTGRKKGNVTVTVEGD